MKIKIIIFIYIILIFSNNIFAGKFKSGEVETSNDANQKVKFQYYFPDKLDTTITTLNIIVCAGGLNSTGNEFTGSLWIEFADKNKFVILTPAFRFNQSDWEQQKSYQYPDVWSGEALIKILDTITFDIPYKLYMIGFSAGAQFVHKFALLYPNITEAVFAHAAGGYEYPYKYIRTRFIVSVGANDNQRIDNAKRFHQLCIDNTIDCELKIYPNLGHDFNSEQINAALNFFEKIKNEN